MDEGETSVRMISERIEITAAPGSYLVDVEFRFMGGDMDETIRVGFPSWGWGGGDSRVINFQTWVDEEEAAFELERGTPAEYERLGPSGAFDTWYVKTVEFPAGEVTTTRVQYRNAWGHLSGYERGGYLYGTGRSWAGSIGRIDVVINLHDDIWLRSLLLCPHDCTADSVETAPEGARTLVATIRNVEPGPDDEIRFLVSGEQPWIPMMESGTERSFAYRAWSESGVHKYTLEQLRVLRNYFFARLGYEFRSEDLAAYFAKQGFYEPGDFVDVLTDVQRRNIETIRAVEAIRNPEGRPVAVTEPARVTARTWSPRDTKIGRLQRDIETPEYTRVRYSNTTDRVFARVTINVEYRVSGSNNTAETVSVAIPGPVVPGYSGFVDVPVPEGMFPRRVTASVPESDLP